MPLTTVQAFAQFIDDIEPSDYHYDTMVPARKKTVDERLTEKFPSGNLTPFDEVYLIGSAAKKTATRPIDDVDVLAVFSNANNGYESFRYNSQNFLYRIQQAYAGTSIQKVGTRGQAIRVFFQNGGYVDIACVFWSGNDNYLLPAGDGSWITTRPFAANNWFATRHAELSYNLKTFVKVLKKWNYAHSKRLNSFHLETMAGKVFASLNNNRRDALLVFFQNAGSYLNVMDPGGTGVVLGANISSNKRSDILNSFALAASRAKVAIEAEGRGDHSESKRQWRMVLGSDFPTS